MLIFSGIDFHADHPEIFRDFNKFKNNNLGLIVIFGVGKAFYNKNKSNWFDKINSKNIKYCKFDNNGKNITEIICCFNYNKIDNTFWINVISSFSFSYTYFLNRNVNYSDFESRYKQRRFFISKFGVKRYKDISSEIIFCDTEHNVLKIYR